MTARLSSIAAITRQFATFCGVGVINTAVGLATILLLSEIFEINYLLANMGGYAVGLAVGFALHKNITFCATATDQPTKAQAFNFLLVFALAYGCQFGALIFLVEQLHWPNLFSQITAVAVYTVINFFGNRSLTFRPAAPPKQ